MEVGIAQDESTHIKDMLNDLFNNVIIATLLVMILILASLGLRSALMVGLAIPGAFNVHYCAEPQWLTLNMVVLLP